MFKIRVRGITIKFAN